ncbi:MAG: ABC transporter ATP-binding protein/permease [Defluviitaleaceae bacterium]|nr:ABC transporter ATP-binding protein/permease [Defluviitaleaceae bacterium]
MNYLKLTQRAYKLWWARQPLLLVSIAVHAAVSALAPFIGIYLSAQILNEIAGTRDVDRLRFLVLAALITAAVLALIIAALARWKNYHSANYWYMIRKIEADKLFSMDFVDVDDAKTHDNLSQIRQSHNWSGWGHSKVIWGLEPLVKSFFTIGGAVALTVSLFTQPVAQGAGHVEVLNHPLFVVGLIAVLLGVTVLSPMVGNKASSYWARHADGATMGNRIFGFAGFFGYDVRRAKDIRMFRQDIVCKSYAQDEKYDSFGPTSQIARWARGPMGALHVASTVIFHIFTISIYLFVCLKAWGGAFGVGNIMQYIGAITALSGGIAALVSHLGTMKNNAPYMQKIFDFLDTPNNMYQGTLTTEKRSDGKYEIEFRNVSFKYPTSDDYALRNVSLKFNVGQRLAVVGQNGSGKTTFIKLLCRLYDPTEGEILLNGFDIRKYDYAQYMDIFSVVFQDFQLLSFPLGENVAASATPDHAKAAECLIKTGFADRLATLPKHLNTCLYKNFEEEGVEVSGGEAQKIALARALYKDAPFLILDEPTAALDPIAESEVYSKMNEIAGTKTAVFISHRLSSCRFCNDIAVFHEGRLIQRGGHDALVAETTGKYHELWHAQAQYYTVA